MMWTINETQREILRFVFPRHANIRGFLYGGQMMFWIVEAGMLAASRIAEGPVILASMDSLDFKAPVKIGDVLYFQSAVEYMGKSSMEVSVLAEVKPRYHHAGRGREATRASFTFVAVDERGKPKPIPHSLSPKRGEEEKRYHQAKERKAKRLQRSAQKKVDPEKPHFHHHLKHTLSYLRLIMPDDAIYGDLMFAGRLLFELDQAASLLALRFIQDGAVTASVEGMDYYAPLRVGQGLNIKLAINYVGRSSLEIGAKICAEDFSKAKLIHAASAYLTFVHVDTYGNPSPIKNTYLPKTPEEKKMWQEAEARKLARIKRLKGT